MGIADLLKTIKTLYPHIVQEYNLSDLRGYKIAIDISIFLYKDVRSVAEKWQEKFLNTLLCLKKNGIIPVCIFDGENPPIEKKLTQISRRQVTAKMAMDAEECKNLLAQLREKIKNKEELDIEFLEKIKQKVGKKRREEIIWTSAFSIKEGLERTIKTLTLQTAPIGDDQRIVAQKIVDALGFSQMRAHGEAEGLCAHLAVKGICDAVLTEDSDVLAYRAPIFIFNLDVIREKVKIIHYQDVLDNFGLTDDQFLDLCIFAGCDYNKEQDGKPYKIKFVDPRSKNKKPKSCGVKSRYDLFLNGHVTSLDDAREILDPDDFEKIKYERIKEIFRAPCNEHTKLPYSRPVDYEKLEAVLKEYGIRRSINSIQKYFHSAQIVSKN